jgi:hypothetical protein
MLLTRGNDRCIQLFLIEQEQLTRRRVRATLRPQPFPAGRRKEQLTRVEPAVAFLLAPRSEVYLNLIWPDLVGLCSGIFY